MADEWDQYKPVDAKPPAVDPNGGWDQFAPAIPPAPDTKMVDGMVENAPGLKNVTNPLEAFMAGLHMSASGLALNKGNPGQYQIPANASFAQKVSAGLGQSVGDLPFTIVGAVGGAAAGAAVTSESGPLAAVGGVAGAGAGSMALPQAVRETMLDYYQSTHAGKPLTFGDFAAMVAKSSWNIGKAAVVGGFAGPIAGKVSGTLDNIAAPAFVSVPATVGTFTAAATGTQAVLDGKVPNAEDFTVAAVTGLTLAGAGHIATSGRLVLNKAGEDVADNHSQIYRETGIPPWEQAHAAKGDEVLNQEILAKDVNGKPNPVNFNATRPQEHEPFQTTTPKESPFVVARKMPPEDTRGKGQFYHGTSKPIANVVDYPGNSESNIYGGGLYTTDAVDVAKGYSKKGGGSERTIYSVNKTGNEKLADMDAPLSSDISGAINDMLPHEELMRYVMEEDKPTTLRGLYDGMRNASADMGYSKSDVQEQFDSIAYNLQKLGYTGLQHEGGRNTGTKPHTVQIHWEPQTQGISIEPHTPAEPTIQMGKKGDVHFNLLSDEELAAEGQPKGVMGFADESGKFYTREEAAAALNQPGRLESMRSQGQAQEGFGKRAAFDPVAHAEQIMPLVRTLEGSGDHAISPKGAIGRYQIMPGTARQYGFDPSRLTDPAYNAAAAKTILTDLSRRFNGDTEAILIAYNAGPGRAFRFIRDGRDSSELPTETRNYLERAGFGGKGGKPPEPPPPPQEPGPAPEGGKGGPHEVPPENREDFSKLTVDSLRSRFQDAIGQEPEKPNTRNFIRQWVSELESARGIDQIAKRQGLLDPQKDISTEDMFRQTYASEDRAQYMFLKGNIDPITFDAKEGPSLLDALDAVKEVGGNLTDFNMYRVALRTVEKAQQNIDTGVFKGGLAEASHIVQMPEMQKYAKANEIMQKWKRGGLEYGRDSGLWSQERLDAMEAANTSHVSLRRILGDDAAFGGIGGGRRGFRASNPLKKMEGSDRQIVEPLTADMDNARQIIRMADRNRAIGHVLGMNEALKDLGLSKLPALEAKAMIAEPGSSTFKPYNMGPEAEKALGPFAIEAKVRGPNSNKFVFYRDGVPEVWQAKDPHVAQLFRGMDSPGEADIVTKILSLPAKIQRAGIVAAPDFGIRVALNDQLSAWVLDPLHPAPYITTLRGVMDVFKKGDTFWELMRRGGLSGAITEGDMAKTVNKAVGDQALLKETGALEKSWNTVTHPIQFAQIINEKLTAMERIGYYKTALEQGIAPNKAAMMGRKAYLDFSEKATGQFAGLMAKFVPFFKATLLGGKQVRDGLAANPGKVMAYAGLGLVVPQIALYALNYYADKFLDEKDRYSSLPQWVRDNYYVTPPIGGVRFKLSRAFTVGPMINIPVERFLEAEFEKDPHAFDGIFGAIAGSVFPSFIPTAARPVLEDVANYSFFAGRPLVSDNLKAYTADEQYNNATSEVAKRISSAIGAHTGLGVAEVSPIAIDNLVQGWTGTIGAIVLHALDAPLGKQQDKEWTDLTFVRGFTVQNPRMNTKQITDFYNDAEKWNALHRDVSKEVKDGREDQAIKDFGEVGQRASVINKFEHALNVQRTALKAIEKNDTMTLDEKRQLSNRIYQDAWHIATMGSKILRGEQPSNEEVSGLQSSVEQNVGQAMGGR